MRYSNNQITTREKLFNWNYFTLNPKENFKIIKIC